MRCRMMMASTSLRRLPVGEGGSGGEAIARILSSVDPSRFLGFKNPMFLIVEGGVG